MHDASEILERPLADLPEVEWLSKLEGLARNYGSFKQLGDRHFAALMEGDETLLVTFETTQAMRALSETGQPMGWDLTKSVGWSNLCLASNGNTWFRDPAVWDYIDTLTDEGFFDAFDQVLFYGAGPCGHAAAAFSVACPGATVVVIQPQATLDPSASGWDDRFVAQRRLDFTSRYGYAPDMIDAARKVFVIYDPTEPLDAMHADLFTRPHVTKLRMPRMGTALQLDLVEMQILRRLLSKAEADKLNVQVFAELYRARRNYRPYLRRLLAALDAEGRDLLSWRLAANVTARMNAPRFQRRYNELKAALGKEGPAH